MSIRFLPVFFIGVLAAVVPQTTPAAAWLEETFDRYTTGSLQGQGDWTGTTNRITIVSTTSLAGNAVLCDADESPWLPVIHEVWRPVKVPDSGRHVFSFAVRVETPTTSSAGVQASLTLGNDQTPAIHLLILPATVMMSLHNDFLLMPPPTAFWDLGNVPGGGADLTTGTYHTFELDLDFGQAGNSMDDFVREVRVDGQAVPGFEGPIWLRKPMDRLSLRNGEAEELDTPDAVLFDHVIGRPVPQSAWLEETFDHYTLGPLFGQGEWTGYTSRVAVVSTNSLEGNAAFCDADDFTHTFAPTLVFRPVKAPSSGEHLFSFAVRVETPTESFAPQATLVLGNDGNHAIRLQISPATADLTINNDFLDCIGRVVWDLGNVPGGYPDLTTGTYHVFELDLDFGRPGDTMDDIVRAVRMDGISYDFGCGSIALQRPVDTLYIANGTAVEGSTPDAVFFDSIIGRPTFTASRRWEMYF